MTGLVVGFVVDILNVYGIPTLDGKPDILLKNVPFEPAVIVVIVFWLALSFTTTVEFGGATPSNFRYPFVYQIFTLDSPTDDDGLGDAVVF